MTNVGLKKFVQFLIKDKYSVFAPSKEGERVNYKEILDAKNFELIHEIPFYPFKKFLLPSEEILFRYKKDKLIEEKGFKKQVIFGINPVDLKALVLLNQVFEKDPWYQGRMKKTLIIGHSLLPEGADQDIFHYKYEEDVLEHLQFDIFIEVKKGTFGSKNYIYTGSSRGQNILDKFGYKKYEHIQYAGPIKEEGPDEMMVKYQKSLKSRYIKDIWERDLGKRCIECGKCTTVCPTCFCFDIKDSPDLKGNSGKRKRMWSSCFYRDFSEISGDHKFLSNTAERIYFWYYHKFVSIPDQFKIPGCVGCGRCTKVCPAGINIFKVLSKLQ